MSIPFNPVTVSIGKDSLSSFKSLHISQRTGAHHSFKLSLDLETGGNRYVHNIGSSSEWLGQTIVVRAANRTMFLGIVTNVRLHREGSDFGCIVVQGYSITYRLETAPGCYSWNDYTIEETVRELCRQANVEVRLNASYKERLDYICRYDESEFDFIRRLALQYQEWMYYDGTALVFGRPKGSQDEIVLEYGTTLSTLEIGLQTLARPEQVFSYHSSSDFAMDSTTPDLAYGHDHIAGKAFRASLGMYGTPARQHALPRIRTGMELDAYMRRKQAAETAETHYIIGESEVPELRVGSVVRLFSSFLERVGELTKDSLGDFIITEIEHDVSEGSYYHNRFKAIPSTVEALPSPKVRLPQAETQMATVISNNDPSNSGRVQVRMNWQTGHMRTGWVRVMTPDGGSSKEVSSNRGFVFIPEVGDQVLLGFRHGDPARPYVMGSLFNGTTGKGGGHSNSTKSITTRSGISVTLNDDNKSLDIKDAGGSSVHLDGNGNIILKAPKDIHIHAGNDMHFMAGHNLNVNVGNSQTSNIGNMQLTNVMQKILVNTPFMQQLVSEFFHTQAGKALFNSQNQIKIEAPETNVVGEQKLFMHSAEKAVVNSQGTMEVRGEQGTSEFNQALPYQKTVEEKAKHCVVYFKRKENYGGEYGFDWFHMGENEAKGDYKFTETIGHHYEEDTAGNKTSCKDGNAAYEFPFEVLPTLVNKKKNNFEYFHIGFKQAKAKEGVIAPELATYYVPRMTVMPGTTAEIIAEVELDGEETKPKEIKLQFDKAEGLKLGRTTLPVRAGKVNLTISCTGELKEKRTLTVLTDDEDTVGKLFILPNSRQHQRDIKVVFVKVKTNLDGTKEKIGKINSIGKDLFTNVLHQALINVDGGIKEAEIDCTEKGFSEEFRFLKGEEYGIDEQKDLLLKTVLLDKLKTTYNDTYKNYYTVFFFGDNCFIDDGYLNGYAYPNSQYGVFFCRYNPSTVPHEMLHALGLPHSFDYQGVPFAYRYHTTDNIMDYSHHSKGPDGNNPVQYKSYTIIERVSLFYWQWKLLNKKIE